MSTPERVMMGWLKEDTGTPQHGSEYYDAFDVYAEFMPDILERQDIVAKLTRAGSNISDQMRLHLESRKEVMDKRLSPLDSRIAALKQERR